MLNQHYVALDKNSV